MCKSQPPIQIIQITFFENFSVLCDFTCFGIMSGNSSSLGDELWPHLLSLFEAHSVSESEEFSSFLRLFFFFLFPDVWHLSDLDLVSLSPSGGGECSNDVATLQIMCNNIHYALKLRSCTYSDFHRRNKTIFTLNRMLHLKGPCTICRLSESAV